jgi:insulysin
MSILNDVISELINKGIVNKGVNKNNKPIYGLPNNFNNYEYFTLPNGLKVFLLQVPGETTFSCRMHVKVGHIYNPVNYEGLAHFLEHMLFMGNDLCDGDNCVFQTLVADCNGYTNAYTTPKSTVYELSSHKDCFMKLLKIWSRFFVNPSFLHIVDKILKELNAVDSEHEKNFGNDSWKKMQLSLSYYDDGLNNKFGTGNTETILGNRSIQELSKTLRDFYNNHYSSDKMTLFIAVNEDDSYINIIKELFGQIKMKKSYTIKNTASVRELHNKSEYYETIKMKALGNENILNLYWLIDKSQKCVDNMVCTSYEIISYLISHKGNNSLHSVLFKENLIVDIVSGVSLNSDTNSMFEIEIALTEKGLNEWVKVLYLVVCYIDKLYISNVFDIYSDEIYKLNIVNMKALPKIESSELLNIFVNIYDTTDVSLEYLPIQMLLNNKEEQKKHLKLALKTMNITNVKVILSSRHINGTNRIEKYYKTDYLYELKRINYLELNNCDKYFKYLPDINQYIPDKIEVYNTDNNNDEFLKLKNVKHIYYVKSDNKYKLPKIYSKINIKLEYLKIKNPIIVLMLKIYFTYVFTKKMGEFNSMDLSSNYFDIDLLDDNLIITIDIYQHTKRNIFIDSFNWFFEKNEHMSFIDRDIYRLVFNNFFTEFNDYYIMIPNNRIMDEFAYLVNPNYNITNQEYLYALKYFIPNRMENKESKINFYNFRDIVIKILTNSEDVRGLFGGSINNNLALSVCNKIDKTISYTKSNINGLDNIILNEAPHINDEILSLGCGIYLGKYNENDLSKDKILKELTFLIFSTYISDKFYHYIRTENNLGYIAYAKIINTAKILNKELYLFFTVQTNIKKNKDALTIFHNYFENILMDNIQKLSNSIFEKLKIGFIELLKEKPNTYDEIDRNLEGLVSFNKNELQDKMKDFDKTKILTSNMKDLTYDKFISNIKNWTNDKNNYRHIELY